MASFTAFIAHLRARRLRRQYRDIERQLHALPPRQHARLGLLALAEIGHATRTDFPHLYGTPAEARYCAWGCGTDIGHERALSTNPEVCLRGMALWLAVAYHETKDSPWAVLQVQHRHVLHLLRELKEIQHGKSPVANWVGTAATA